MNKTKPQTDIDYFANKLAEYKSLIDTDIESYSKIIKKSVLQEFGANSRLESDAFLEILGRGGKRIRGALVMVGYEMSGGTNTKMILEVARAIEMIHAYILIIDDIQDRSAIRRGGPTAHYALADYHRAHELADNSEHFGVSIALNSAISGAHKAQILLANIDAPEQLRLKVISIMNSTMQITAHGQTSDIMNEVVAFVSMDDINQVLEWKTAHYSFLNPLHIGMVLAGADTDTLNNIKGYAMHTGKAFQITDDIIGVFGSEQVSGKSSMDDIREGKRTILSVYAFEQADKSDKNFLIQMLGNHNITPTEFERCKSILIESGALSNAKKMAELHVYEALNSLKLHRNNWSTQGYKFLSGLSSYLINRSS